MYTVFISTPMHGKTKKEVEKRLIDISRKAMDAACAKFGWKYDEVWWSSNIDCREPGPLNKNPRVYRLGNAIQEMSSVDCVYFDEGWEHANGCLVERFVALKYDIPVLFYNVEYGVIKDETGSEGS